MEASVRAAIVVDEPAVRLHDLSKRFGATRALDRVSFDIMPGRVHALIGPNGSGKSTLVKLLAGVSAGEPGGRVEVRGAQVGADRIGPRTARLLGFRFVHQDLAVFDDLTVAENVALGTGFPRGRSGRVLGRMVSDTATSLFERLGFDGISPSQRLGDLRPADRSLVAIARALADIDDLREAVLVLDEPTASLTTTEVDRLSSRLRGIASAGQTVLYVSHRLPELVDLADDVTLLRDGGHVETRSMAGLDAVGLAALISTDPTTHSATAATRPALGAPLLEVRGLTGGAIRDVTFSLRRGEIVGIAGLLGSGRTELLRMLFGLMVPRGGTMALDSRAVRFRHPAEAIAAGIALVPEDRLGQAMFRDLTVAENLGLATIGRHGRFAALRRERVGATPRHDIERCMASIDPHAVISTLSGGNQQKVVVGRWLATAPRLLLLDEPTQGIDVCARAGIHELIRDVASRGAGVLAVSSDIDELVALSDRILVLVDGRIGGQIGGSEMTISRCVEAITGRRVEA